MIEIVRTYCFHNMSYIEVSMAHVRDWYFPYHCETMMTSSNGNIFRVTGPLCGEFTGACTKTSEAEIWYIFDLRLNKRLSKRSRGWWFETQSSSLWRHCSALWDFAISLLIGYWDRIMEDTYQILAMWVEGALCFCPTTTIWRSMITVPR